MTRFRSNPIRHFARLAVVGLVCALPARGAILALEDFDTGLNGWDTRDGDLAVSWDNIDLWAVGSYDPQVFPSLQDDAFRIDSGSDYLGDYITPGLTQIQFDLNAVDVLPSSVWIRMIDGTDVYEHQFAVAGSVGNFQTYTADLDWSFGWSGASGTAFTNALTSIDAVEIQVVRNGISAQDYYLDNVETLDTPLSGGPGGPGGAVPEPTTISLIAIILGFGGVMHRRRRHGRTTS